MDALRLQVVSVVRVLGFKAGWQVCASDHQSAPLVVGRYAQGQNHVAAVFVDLSATYELGEPIVEEDGDSLEGRLCWARCKQCIARCECFGVGQLADARFLQGDDVRPIPPFPLCEEANFRLQVALYILLQDAQRARFCGHYSRGSKRTSRFPVRVIDSRVRGACFFWLRNRAMFRCFCRPVLGLTVGWR